MGLRAHGVASVAIESRWKVGGLGAFEGRCYERQLRSRTPEPGGEIGSPEEPELHEHYRAGGPKHHR